MTPKEALDFLKNRISKLALNRKIGNRDIANLEVKDIVMGIETHVTPVFEQAITELEELKNQQEKKDKLLELYRECYEEGYFWLEIQQRIKALEEELE